MNVSPVGNPLLAAATLAAQKQSQANQPAPSAPKPSAPAETQEPEAAPPRVDAAGSTPRVPENLEQLADDVLAIFEDSPDRLEQLVATLKRLEGSAS